MRFELSELPFELNALEPLMSRKSLEFHHRIYQNTYLANLNNLIRGTKFKNLDLETIIKVTDGPLFNNAAQVWNHSFYFECLRPGGTSELKDSFAEVIKYSFGSESFFKSSFVQAAESLFGVGWVWLVLNQKGTVEILQKSNAGNPLRIGLIPLLTCDLWEHAYYLDYQNRLCDYIDAFWKLLDWEMVEKRYNTAMDKHNNINFEQ
jgi:Fe-Mn family superoxide dismutase